MKHRVKRPWLDAVVREHYGERGLLVCLAALAAAGHHASASVVTGRANRLGIDRDGCSPIRKYAPRISRWRKHPYLDQVIRQHYVASGLLTCLVVLRAAGYDVSGPILRGRANRLGVTRNGLPPTRQAVYVRLPKRPWFDEAIREHYAERGVLGTLKVLQAAGHDAATNAIQGRALRLGIKRNGRPPIRPAGFADGRPRDWHGRLLPLHDDDYSPLPEEIRAKCIEMRKGGV